MLLTPIKLRQQNVSAQENINMPRAIKRKNTDLFAAYNGSFVFKVEESMGVRLTRDRDQQVHILGPYIPRWTRAKWRNRFGGNYSYASAFTKRVRNLKNNKTKTNRNNAIEYFTDLLKPLIIDGSVNEKIIICSVPTSTPLKRNEHGATVIAKQLALLTNHIDGTDIVARTQSKTPCHQGGARTQEAAAAGLVIDSSKVVGKTIFLIDDVVDTAVSMYEIRERLYEIGAKRVVCLCLSGVLNKEGERSDKQSALESYLIKIIKQNQPEAGKKEAITAVFDTVGQAYPNTPETPFTPLLLAERRREVDRAIQGIGVQMLNFDEDAYENDADMNGLLARFKRMRISPII